MSVGASFDEFCVLFWDVWVGRSMKPRTLLWTSFHAPRFLKHEDALVDGAGTNLTEELGAPEVSTSPRKQECSSWGRRGLSVLGATRHDSPKSYGIGQ